MSVSSLMIRASAGSGKTYQLSNRFLALLAAGAEPSSMIALTFTRKAAGEFGDRILSRLAAGALEKSDELAAALRPVLHGDPETGMPGLFGGEVDPELSRERFQALLQSLVGELDRVMLGTIDSFFVRIAKRFPFELGLSEFQLLEEDAKQAEKARVLGRIFREVPERQKEAFLGAFRLATHGKEQNRLCDLLDNFLEDHHERYLGAPDREVWGNLGLFWPDGCPWADVDDFAGAAGAVLDLIETVEAEPKPHATWLKGWDAVAKWAESYQPGDGGKLPTAMSRMLGLLEDLAAGEAVDVFSKKEHLIQGRLAEAMTTLVGGYLRSELEARQARTKGIWAVLWAYESIYDREVRRQGRLGFSDITRLLAEGGLTTGGRARLESRLDARYRQWMLDEFQDTSRSQWEVMEGLLDEVVQDPEGERSLFVVGDTKQGIYGWRGGEPRLFDELLQRPGWSQRLKEWGMQVSYRSQPEVLELANVVCDPAVLAGRFPDAAVARWKYEKHRSAATREKGYAVVVDTGAEESVGEDEEDLSPVDRCLRQLFDEVRPVERGWSCAVLVRSNAKARKIVDFLRLEFPAMAVEMDAEIELACDNPLGVALLDWFRWLAHPKDLLARGHVARSPVGEFLASVHEAPEIQWQECRRRMVEDGMAGLLGWLGDGLEAAEVLNPFLGARWEGILRAAVDYDESGRRDLDEWVSVLESLKQREYSGAGAVQVMTVHKAKGLEFDMVVMPDLGGGAFDEPSKAKALDFRDAHGRIQGVILPPTRDLLTADPAVREWFDSWSADQCYERFCNLYVALTRAKRATYVLLPKAPKQASTARRFDLWMRDAVGDEGGEVVWAGNTFPVLWSRGDAGWFAGKTGSRPDDEEGGGATRLGRATPRRERMTPSGAKKDVAKVVVGSPTGKAFGTEVHAAFERVGWVDEEEPALRNDEAGQLVSGTLAAEGIRPIFERGGRNVTLFREQSVEAILDGKWLSGVIDRLHVHEGGKRVEIIDFKTDAVDSAAELVERYAGQMEAYRRVMRQVYPEAEVECLLLSTKLRCWVSV